jgi:hypothetical protein
MSARFTENRICAWPHVKICKCDNRFAKRLRGDKKRGWYRK